MKALLMGLTVYGLLALMAWLMHRDHVRLHGKGCRCGNRG